MINRRDFYKSLAALGVISVPEIYAMEQQSLTETIQWIDVNDRLPQTNVEQNGLCLVLSRMLLIRSCGHTQFGQYHRLHPKFGDDTKGEWSGWATMNLCRLYSVTHWAEAPSGPQVTA